MRESRWEIATRDGILCDWNNYLKPKLGDVPLARFDKFKLQTHFNDLAAADYSEWVVKRVKTLLSSIFVETVDLGFLTANPWPRSNAEVQGQRPASDLGRGCAAALYDAIPSLRDRLIFRMGISLGPRTSEVFGFTVDKLEK